MCEHADGRGHLRVVPAVGGDEPGLVAPELMGHELVRQALALALAFITQHAASSDPDLALVSQVARQLRQLAG